LRRSEPGAIELFENPRFRGEIASRLRPAELAAELARLLDPAAALESLHWGRNYLYRAQLAGPAGPLDVVVKQYREDDLKGRFNRWLKGPKAARAFAAARACQAAGVATPEPILWARAVRRGGPSFYVCRHAAGGTELRYLLRAARAGTAAEDFPQLDAAALLAATGRLLARCHAAGLQHRDASVGNFLVVPTAGGGFEVVVVDLSRARLGRPPGWAARHRDLNRLALDRPELWEPFLTGYWGAAPTARQLRTFQVFQRAFESKGRSKRPLKAVGAALKALGPRRAHAHIPQAPEGAGRRDKVVWDYLSDQPHQHAGRWEKALVRLADAPAHVHQLVVAAAALPRIRRRYHELQAGLYQQPVPFDGIGLAVRPYPDAPEAVLDGVADLGVGHVLVRLHPWQQEHDTEEELARALAERGITLAFALPQNRDLVNDPARWEAAIAELAERFTPYGRSFQLGHAINRSKWGIWRPEEYLELAERALPLLRRHPGVEVLGPGVIDFEPQPLASLLNLKRPAFRLDGVASLLYVDRRGAPESPQLGFDTVGKVALMKAIADTARNSAPRLWVTEVNWPLREGPHSPAGKGVSVDEEHQASYLARYYLLALGTGWVERVYWWQLIARGYGLVCPDETGGLRRRPAFAALAQLQRRLGGSLFQGPLPAPEGARLYGFQVADGTQVVVGWTVGETPLRASLPGPAQHTEDRDGHELPSSPSPEVELVGAPRYFALDG
jgi:tRNA A-37 threonylcarbamoyl transferase component Bud32